MENWQKEHINKNIYRLISLTTCSVNLISQLQAAKLLSTEEVERLQISSSTESEKAKLLFEILITRNNSYEIIMSALRSTRQSGAHEILKNHGVKYINFMKIKYDTNNVLGEGGFGTKVYSGIFGGREVAVKVQHTQFVKYDIIQNEIDMLVNLDFHQNVVQYFTAEGNSDVVCIVLERCAISLQDEVRLKLYDFEDAIVLKKCTKGLKHLHSLNVIHRDLKPGNILFTANGEVKISDFGVSRLIPPGRTSVTATGIVGTTDWMAPEVLKCCDMDPNSPPKIGKAADIFALGCIFYFTLTKGKHPFGTSFKIPSNVLEDNPDLKFLDVSDEWRSLIRTMISNEPSQRPSTDDVLSHQIFAYPSNVHGIYKSYRPYSSPTMEREQFRNAISAFRKSISELPSFRNSPDHFSQELGQLTECQECCPDRNGQSAINNASSRPSDKTRRVSLPNGMYGTDVPVESSIRMSPINDEATSSENNTWMTFHLRRNWHNLENCDAVKEKFLQKMHGQGVLSDFYLNRSMRVLKQRIGYLYKPDYHKLFDVPFVREEFYEYLLKDLRESPQTAAYEILENGYTIMEKWASPDAVFVDTDFASLQEGIGYHCDVQLLRKVYENKIDKTLLFQKNTADTNLLHVASEFGDISAVKYLILIGVDVNSQSKNKRTPLHLVGGQGSNAIAITQILLDAEAYAYARDVDGQNVAFRVCLKLMPEEYHEWAEYMISEGHKDVFCQKDGNDNTPVHFALQNSEMSEDTIHLFSSELNFDFNTTNKIGSTGFMLAAQGGQCRSILQCIGKLGGDWTLKDKRGRGILHYSVFGGSLESVEHFLSLGADPNARDVDMCTPLHFLYKSRVNFIETTKLFMERGADIMALSKMGDTIAHTLGRKSNSKGDYKAWKDFMIDKYPNLFLIKNSEGDYAV